MPTNHPIKNEPTSPRTKVGRWCLATARQSAMYIGCDKRGYIFAIGEYDTIRRLYPGALVMAIATYDTSFPANESKPRKPRKPRKPKNLGPNGTKLMTGPGCTR